MVEAADVIIVGGGLAGLVAAHELHLDDGPQQIAVTLIEKLRGHFPDA